MVEKIRSAYNGTINIKFLEDKDVYPEVHEYHVQIGSKKEYKVGVTVSGATKVLDKPALVGWATKMCAEYLTYNNHLLAQKVVVQTQTGLAVDEIALAEFVQNMKAHGKGKKKEAATVGTMTHAYIDQHIKHVLGTGPKPVMPVNAQVQNSVGAFLKWEQAHHVVYHDAERLVYSKKYDFAGQLDIDATIDGERAIADNKTSSGIYDEMWYQTRGYQLAAEEESIFEKAPIKYDCRWILRFDKVTGEFQAERSANHTQDLRAFLACLELAKIAVERRKTKDDAKTQQRAVRLTNKRKTTKKTP